MIDISLTDKQATKALGDFIKSLFPSITVVKGQVNRVPMPQGDLCVISNLGRRFLSMTQATYTDTESVKRQHLTRDTEYRLQVDFYGERAGEYIQQFCVTFTDWYGWHEMPEDVKPLTLTDPNQIPLITGEKEYLERWMTEVSLQINQVVSTDQDFFDVAGETTVIAM